MRWLRLLLVAQWSVGFEEYEEMPSRWQAGMLGVFGRMALYSDVAPGVYMNPDKHGGDRIERQYNMLTGKTSVLDVATVASFFDDDRVPPAARDWIAQRHKPTCEDMTLHWHAATLRPNPPVWLQFSGDDALELDADLREPAADGHQTGEMHLDVATGATCGPSASTGSTTSSETRRSCAPCAASTSRTTGPARGSTP